MYMSKFFFNCLAVLGLLFGPFTSVFAQSFEREKITIHVKGLVCEFCASTIKKAFSKNKTIESITVSLSDKTVTLTTKGVNTAKDDYITKTILDNGYNVDGKIDRQPCDTTCDIKAVSQTAAGESCNNINMKEIKV